MKAQSKPKVAIVHDWLIGGGAERVVEELHKLYPEAPIYTSYCTDEWRQRLDGKVVTGYLQHFGSIRKFLPPLRALWFSHLDLNDYDLVISSSGAEAKGIKRPPGAVHVSYIHAPTHYYWARYDEYMKSPGFGWLNPLARLGLKLLVAPMRRWDYKAAQRPDFIIANSNFTKQQIKKYYGRDSVVIHPPVDIDRFKQPNKPAPHQSLSEAASNQVTKHQAFGTGLSNSRSGFLIAGRQTPYKRFNLAVAACTQLGLPLTVIGSGPDHQKLVRMSGPTIKFVTSATDAELVKYFQSAEAFIFPGIDDFGIVAAEALAAGTPVIAYKAGGALDYINKDTGLFFNEPTAESLISVLEQFKAGSFKNNEIANHAQQFSISVFHRKIKEFIAGLSLLNN